MYRQLSFLCVINTFVAVLYLWLPASSRAAYSVIDLGTLVGESFALDVNNSSWVVGYYSGNHDPGLLGAFLWREELGEGG